LLESLLRANHFSGELFDVLFFAMHAGRDRYRQDSLLAGA